MASSNISLLISEVAQSCPTLCDPMDCSLPGPSVHGIFQVRILEWVAISSPRDLPDSGIEPRSPTLKADSLLSGPPNFSQAFRPFLKHLKSFTHPFRHFLEGGEEKHSCAF